jgi:hypothetical protein
MAQSMDDPFSTERSIISLDPPQPSIDDSLRFSTVPADAAGLSRSATLVTLPALSSKELGQLFLFHSRVREVHNCR